jgi:metal-responsive CopG/Arc/MetJ family transcriptional regulator
MSIPVLRKKRGRPATGQDPVLAIRLSKGLRSAIESWAMQQIDKPSRSEAIRRLLEFALAAKSRNRENTTNQKAIAPLPKTSANQRKPRANKT